MINNTIILQSKMQDKNIAHRPIIHIDHDDALGLNILKQNFDKQNVRKLCISVDTLYVLSKIKIYYI